MPGATIVAEPFCIVGRRVRRQLGPYFFSPNRKETVPLKSGMRRNMELGPNTASTHGVENERLDDLQQIAHWALQGEPGPVMVLTSQLPGGIIAPLMMAGQKYVDDLARYCERVVFSPYLAQEDQPVSALILETDRLKPEEMKPWKEMRCDLGKTMFLNLYDAQGQRFLAVDMGLWGIAGLLGYLVLNAQLIARGIPSQELSDNARTAFMLGYHRELIRGVDAHLTMRYGAGYDQSLDSEDLRGFIKCSEAEIRQAERFLTPRDAEFLASL